jgi:hypothetical protein
LDRAPSVPVDRSDIVASFLLQLVETRTGRKAPTKRRLKGRDASLLAVPPFLLPTWREASLSCLIRGSHPLVPTCRAECRLSSGDCSRARSLVVDPYRACTAPDSLVVIRQVLIPVVAGIRLVRCGRFLPHCTLTVWRPPERRAGFALAGGDDRHPFTSR